MNTKHPAWRCTTLLGITMTMLWACRPSTSTSSPPPAEPAQPAQPAADTSDPVTESATTASSESSAPVASDIPQTCEVTVAILDPGGVTGQGSDHDGQAAKDAAWAEACAQLEQAKGVDCRDSDRTSVRAERSSSIQSQRGDGSLQTLHRHSVTLTPRRVATGFGDAMGDHALACRNAQLHACQTALDRPCPPEDVRVIAIDGRPPRPAAAEASPAPPSSI